VVWVIAASSNVPAPPVRANVPRNDFPSIATAVGVLPVA
jgi:hypothetical protein